tara:strand:- start:348 stop:626 length:279 start_codon:yes stop_codon:yes gene_type:complete
MDQFLLIFLIAIAYILLLFSLKYYKIGKKIHYGNCTNSCPDCKDVLNRIRRRQRDQLINHLTFGIFDARRYVCNNCGWDGLRWEDQFRPGKD